MGCCHPLLALLRPGKVKADADSTETPPRIAHNGKPSPEVGNSAYKHGAVTGQEQIGNQNSNRLSLESSPQAKRGTGENGAGDLHQRRGLGNSEGLWQQAYDKLEDDNPDLVKQYKTLLVHIAEWTKPSDINEIEGNREIPSEEALECAIKKGLERLEEYDAVMEAAAGVVDVILGCKDLICSALTAVPQVAAVRTGMTFVLQGLSNAAAQSVVNREGILYVASLVRWYCQLFIASAGDEEDQRENLLVQLRDQFVGLYSKIIEYQMRSVVLYHRNRFSRAIRGAMKIDAWEATLEDIKKDEKELYRRLQSFHGQGAMLHLRSIRQGISELLTLLESSQKWEISKMIGSFNLEGLEYERFKDENPDEEQHTCDWFLEMNEVKSWNKGLLLLTAVPGQGKSVLARFLANRWAKEGTVCHFFLKDDSRVRKKSSNAFCALLHQLLMQHPYVASIKKVREEIAWKGPGLFTSTWDLRYILRLVLERIDDTVIIIIDALDECQDDSENDRHGLLEFLRSFRETGIGTTKILATSRAVHQITEDINRNPDLFPENFTHIDLDQHQTEFLPVINKVVDKWVEGFPDWTEQLQEKVKLELKGDCSQHTFIWLRLIFTVLKSHRTQTLSDDQWLALIKSASDIDATYEKLLASVDAVVVDDVKLLFSLIMAAAEPLTVAEINEALYVCKGGNPGGVYMNNDRLMRKWINDNTAFLATISAEADGRVQFIHQTAREFLKKLESPEQQVSGAHVDGSSNTSPSSFKRFTTEKEAHVIILDACEKCLLHKTRQWKDEKTERGRTDPDDAGRLHIKDFALDTYLQRGFLDYALRFYAFHFDKLGVEDQCYPANGCLCYPFGTQGSLTNTPEAAIISGNASRLLPAVRSQNFAWCQLAQMSPRQRGSVRVPEVYCVIRLGHTLFAITEYVSGKLGTVIPETPSELLQWVSPALRLFLSFEIPEGMPLGPMRDRGEPLAGVIEHPLFFEGTSATTGRTFGSVRDLEVFIDETLPSRPSRHLKFGPSHLIFTQLTAHAIRVANGDSSGDDDLTYVVDFQDAAILPLCFLAYVRRETTPLPEMSFWEPLWGGDVLDSLGDSYLAVDNELTSTLEKVAKRLEEMGNEKEMLHEQQLEQLRGNSSLA